MFPRKPSQLCFIKHHSTCLFSLTFSLRESPCMRTFCYRKHRALVTHKLGVSHCAEGFLFHVQIWLSFLVPSSRLGGELEECGPFVLWNGPAARFMWDRNWIFSPSSFPSSSPSSSCLSSSWELLQESFREAESCSLMFLGEWHLLPLLPLLSF